MILYADDEENKELLALVLPTDGILDLTPTEYKILSLLLRRNGEIVSKKEILHELERDIYLKNDDDNLLSVHVCKLRKKLKAGKIEAARKEGYRFHL